jgi:hypothetical protein
MLNDCIETVINKYTWLTEQGVAKRADEWLAKKVAAPQVSYYLNAFSPSKSYAKIP